MTESYLIAGLNFLRYLLIVVGTIIFTAGVGMGEVKIEKLGNVTAGLIEYGDTEIIHDLHPIILGNRDGLPLNLYVSIEQKMRYMISLDLKQQLDVLPIRSIERHNNAGNYLPITYHSKISSEIDERTHEFITFDTISIGDLDGDESQELIFAVHPAGIDVYDRHKLREKFRPYPYNPESFQYRVIDINRSETKKRDSFFYTFAVEPYDANVADETFLIILIDKQGVRQIRLNENKFHIKRVLATAAFNSVDSDNIEEIIVCAQVEGRRELLLGRYSLNGVLTGKQKWLELPDQDMASLHFINVPQKNRIVLFNRTDSSLRFLNMEDTRQDRVLEVKIDDDMPIGPIRMANFADQPVILTLNEDKTALYAVNEKGFYFIRVANLLQQTKVKQPLFKINSSSPCHEVVDVLPVNRNNSEILIVESRKPQFKNLSDEELTWAGKRFLGDDDLDYCQSYEKPSFDDFEKRRAKRLMAKKGIDAEINSLADIQQILPELYKTIIQEARERLNTRLEVKLLKRLSRTEINKLDYKNKDEYFQWLQRIYLGGEIVIKTINIAVGNAISRQTITGYFHEKEIDFDSELRIPYFQYYRNVMGSFLVIALKKDDSETGQGKMAYYLIRN